MDGLRWVMAIGFALISSGAAAQSANSGLPGSTCEPVALEAPPGSFPLDPGTSTTILDEHDPPAYYEWGSATGGTENGLARGLVMIIHGGGWYETGTEHVVAERIGANYLRSRGWDTLNLTHRGCGQSLDDVLRFYDIARDRLGPETPVCATGQSTGAHLALMLAALRPELACVLSEAAPIDLVAIGGQSAFANRIVPIPPGISGPQFIANLAAAAFGEERLAELSPITHAGLYATSGVRILAASAEQDELVPVQQLHALADAVRQIDPAAPFVSLPVAGPDESGTAFFVHGLASPASIANVLREIEALLASIQP
jgi:acetyl esterase/lipase